MATAEDNREYKPSPNDTDKIISATAQTQRSLVSSFGQWLSQVDDHGGIVSRVQSRLESYTQWLLAVEQGSDVQPEDADSWTINFQLKSSSGNGSVIVVRGLGSDYSLEIPAKDDKEVEDLTSDDYLGYMVKICTALSQSQKTLQSLLETANAIKQETSQLSQPPEKTLKSHIRRLQEYNDIKDIGQQLMGLVAENRGVPVRALYENREFGVGSES
ncbi:hypothetical protein VTI74DRAFT_9193 [Chaetomium olivicolor]